MRYNDRELVSTFRVLESGRRGTCLTGTAIEYHIQVQDERGTAIEGVLVEIIAGGNTGMQAVSDRFGRAIFHGESACGPITVRGTKAATNRGSARPQVWPRRQRQLGQ